MSRDAEVKAWLTSSRSLGARKVQFEKLCASFLESAAKRIPGAAAAQDLHVSLESSRESFAERVRGDLEGVKSAALLLRGSLASALQGRLVDEHEIEELFANAEKKAKAFKANMREDFADLTDSERLLAKDLEAFWRRAEGWDREDRQVRVAAAAAPAGPPRAQPRSAWAPPPDRGAQGEGGTPEADGEPRAGQRERQLVLTLDRELSRVKAGLEQWRDPERDGFLRLWTQTFGVRCDGTELEAPVAERAKRRLRQLCAAAATVLNERTAEEVENYARLHCQRLRLARRKKDALRRWRHERAQAEKAGEASEEGGAGGGAAATDAEEEEEGARRRAARRAREQEAKRVQIARWREERAKEEGAQRRREELSAARGREAALRRKQAQLRKKERVVAFQLEQERRRELERASEHAGTALRPGRRRVDLESRVREDLKRAEQRRGLRGGRGERGRAERERRQQRQLRAMEDRAARAQQRAAGKPGERLADEAAVRAMAWAGVTRDAGRLTARTAAARRREYTPEDLDDMENRRRTQGAHESKVHYGARDLVFVGRATPSWRNGL